MCIDFNETTNIGKYKNIFSFRVSKCGTHIESSKPGINDDMDTFDIEFVNGFYKKFNVNLIKVSPSVYMGIYDYVQYIVTII